VDIQINNYTRSFNRKFGPNEEARPSHAGMFKYNKMDTVLARQYGREILQAYFNSQLSKSFLKIVQLHMPGRKHSPLDFCDTTGKIAGRIKYCGYQFVVLDHMAKRGIANPQWVIDNLRLACGSEGRPGEEFFRCGLTTYIDQLGDTFILSVASSDLIIDGKKVIKQAGRGYVHFGEIGPNEEYYKGVSYDYTAAWFIPSNYWLYIGRIPQNKMMNISTSWAAKWIEKFPGQDVVYPNQKLTIYRTNLHKQANPDMQFEELRVINLD
jgi:hypothetical protein